MSHIRLASDPAYSFDILEEVWLENCLPPALQKRHRTIVDGLFRTDTKLHTAHVDASLWRSGSLLAVFQLKTLSAYGDIIPTFLAEASRAENLEELLLCFHYGHESIWKPLPPIRVCFPLTTTLKVHQHTGAFEECIADIYPHMMFPELQHLTLYFDASFHLPWTRWREDGGCCRHLTIGGYAVDYGRSKEAKALDKFLSDAAFVEDLCLGNSSIPSLLISKLTITVSSGASPFRPRLRHLDCRVSPDDHEALVNMVLSRVLEPHGSFRSLRLAAPLKLEGDMAASEGDVCLENPRRS